MNAGSLRVFQRFVCWLTAVAGRRESGGTRRIAKSQAGACQKMIGKREIPPYVIVLLSISDRESGRALEQGERDFAYRGYAQCEHNFKGQGSRNNGIHR